LVWFSRESGEFGESGVVFSGNFHRMWLSDEGKRFQINIVHIAAGFVCNLTPHILEPAVHVI